MYFNCMMYFHSQYSHQHVSARIPAIFRAEMFMQNTTVVKCVNYINLINLSQPTGHVMHQQF